MNYVELLASGPIAASIWMYFSFALLAVIAIMAIPAHNWFLKRIKDEKDIELSHLDIKKLREDVSVILARGDIINDIKVLFVELKDHDNKICHAASVSTQIKTILEDILDQDILRDEVVKKIVESPEFKLMNKDLIKIKEYLKNINERPCQQGSSDGGVPKDILELSKIFGRLAGANKSKIDDLGD